MLSRGNVSVNVGISVINCSHLLPGRMLGDQIPYGGITLQKNYSSC